MAAAWSNTHKSPGVALSNGKLTATFPATEDINTYTFKVRANASFGSGQKKFFSFNIGEIDEDNWTVNSFGICNLAFDVVTPMFAGPQTWLGGWYSVGFWDSTNQSIFVNQSVVIGGWVLGGPAVLDVAVDTILRRIWFRIDGGNWNNSATASPASGTEGVDISDDIDLPYFPAAQGALLTEVTLNTAGPFTYAAPAGFDLIELSSSGIHKSAGTRFYIGEVINPDAVEDMDEDDGLAYFEALTAWQEIDEVETLGEVGDTSETVSFASLSKRRVRKLKTTRDAGTMALLVARDPLDAGQMALVSAEKTDFNYAFRIQYDDEYGSTDYFGGQVMSRQVQIGGAQDITKRAFNVAVNTAIYSDPTDAT